MSSMSTSSDVGATGPGSPAGPFDPSQAPSSAHSHDRRRSVQSLLDEADDRVVFRHQLVHDAIYQHAPPPARRLLHREAAVALLAAAGTFALAGCATLEEEAVDATSDTYKTVLTGANEVGGGDPDGYGRAEISVSDGFGQVCWEIKDVTGIDTPTAAHIHYGRAGTNGPPVFTLERSNEGRWQGCKDGAEWTQNRLQGNPADFYVNVHNAAYPNGAIRGQLSDMQ